MNNLDFFTLKRKPTNFIGTTIISSESAYDCVKQFYSDDIDIYESLFILLLNNASQSVGFAKISQGGINSTIADVKLIALYVIQSLATQIIIVHNHPSGNLSPSDADIEITKKIKESLKFLDSRVSDHLIISKRGYFSFLEQGIL
jgi:DNA repair protein RadC